MKVNNRKKNEVHDATTILLKTIELKIYHGLLSTATMYHITLEFALILLQKSFPLSSTIGRITCEKYPYDCRP
ncbi:8649_t:CDS:2 [Ambispora leptoticha]|uniref:8649_t:CDS:1 n=1 Tax=Ambispora leptoticha TaxID=144679 RepID=A0A9N9A954_9GLOM|nr:8649_t:CDS:2 [Ambispora leptoticha]